VSLLTQGGIRLLGIGIDDAITAGSLDWAHRDPFDRMIVAQASRLNLMLVTRDAEIQTFMDARSVLGA
jgi:PIN domain nuclease of toxin-antitoxin system